jgi:lysophospholipase L1-like esterase
MHRIRRSMAASVALTGVVSVVVLSQPAAEAAPGAPGASQLVRTVTAPERHVPTVAVIGDSYTALSGAPGSAGAWTGYVARAMGWRLVAVNSDPSGGFVSPGINGTFADALDSQPLPRDVDFVFIQGGFNDQRHDPDAVPPAVAALIDQVQEQAPHAVPIVIGAFQPFEDRLDSPGQLRVARAIGRDAAVGDTRYIAGYLCEFEVGPDRVHPSPRGHQQIGQWVVQRLTRGLDNGDRLRRHASGEFYTA